jgi:hypothetical protein
MIGQAQRVVWPGGEHSFCFAIGELRALEQRLDAGVAVVLLRLLKGEFKLDDVVETLRLGLQGGGMSEKQAMKTIERAFPVANLYELSVTSARVLTMFISWPTGQGEDVPEEPAEGKTTATPTTGQSSPTDEPDGPAMSGPLQ